MEQARMGMSGSHLGSNNIFCTINPEYRNKRSVMARERPPEIRMQIFRNRFGEDGSRSWYSAMYLDKAVLSPETVMAKQIVEIGKIS